MESSFQLANIAPPLALLLLPQGCSYSSCLPSFYPNRSLHFSFCSCLQLSFRALLQSSSKSCNSWSMKLLKNCESHIDASHSRQPTVKGERLARNEVNAVMIVLLKTACFWSRFASACSHYLLQQTYIQMCDSEDILGWAHCLPPLLEILNTKNASHIFQSIRLRCATPPLFGSGDFSKLQIADSHSKSGFDKNVSKPDGPNESIC